MKIRPSAYFVIASLIFGSVVIIYSLTYRYLESRLLPIIIAGIVLLLALLQLRKELRMPKNGPEQEPANEKGPGYALSQCWPSAAWICGFCLALFMVGFIVSIPLFVFSYIKSHGRGWAMSIIVSSALTIFIYLVFVTFLQVDLYPGLLFELLS